ncbi:helix-turn-helix transcriptional regulator [Actinoallomurus liliacearum]|uniref:Helix-turn-helix transcriptional regulator n=1 Tax=Actinoallomurus liliacearum TaxID=1080073 RepID=A0ABP8TSH4_9ACTN
MPEEPNIGARLRVLRRWRGLTIVQLADLSGVSKSQISYIERGERMLDRRSQIAALARALRVSETELTGLPHVSADPEQSAPHGVVPLLREVLTGNTFDDPAVDRARPLPELESLLFGELQRLKHKADYARRGVLVAPVFEELHFHVATGDEAGKQHALRLLVEACEAVGMTLRFLGYRDLAYLAAVRALDAARLLGHPVFAGQAAYLRCQFLPKLSSWDRPFNVAQHAAERLEPYVGSSRVASETYGMLHLSASLAAAAVNRPDLADDHFTEATRVAARVGEHDDAWSAFGPTNVDIWGVAIAMEHGDYGKAVEVAKKVDPMRLLHRERQAVFYADTGRALAHLNGRQRDAVEMLKKAELIAPQRIRNSPPVQETITYLLNKHLRISPALELRAMADRMGVLH